MTDKDCKEAEKTRQMHRRVRPVYAFRRHAEKRVWYAVPGTGG